MTNHRRIAALEDNETSPRRQRLDEALHSWFCSLDAGTPPDADEFSRRHADLQPELGALLATHVRFDELSKPLRSLLDTSFDESEDRSPGLCAGRTLGDYELLELIGQGGMGVVYKARHKRLHRLVAVKMIRSSRLLSASDVHRFRNEAEVLAGLDHPNIAPVYEVGEFEGQLKGDGTFLAPRTYATAAGPLSVAIADVNGDGKPDLVVGTRSGVEILLGNGDGTFQPEQAVDAGVYSRSVAVADVNGDGKPDLIVTNSENNTLDVLLGNGNGTFQPPQHLAVGNEPECVAVTDLNGDGKPDLVVANYGSDNVSVLLGNGNGSFAAAQNFSTGPNGNPDFLTVADLNGDGKPDLLVADYGGNVSMMLGNGDGTFQNALTVATVRQNTRFAGGAYGYGPGNYSLQNVAVADLNGDGKPDLVMASSAYNSVSVLLGNGNGTFQAPQTFTANNYGGQPEYVAVGDFNGDGTPDLAISEFGGTFDVLFGVPKPASSTTLSSSGGTSVFGQEVTFTATVSSNEAGVGTPPGSVDFFDETTNTNLGTVALTSGSASLEASTFAIGNHTIVANYQNDGAFLNSSASVTQTVNPAYDPNASNPSQDLQTAITSQLQTSPRATTLTVQASTSTDADNVVSAVNGLSAQSTAVTVTLNLASGTYSDLQAAPPAGVTLVISGNGSTTTIVGNSPALTVTAGNVLIENLSFSTATNAPTILVTGGSLTLRNDVVQESTDFTDAAIAITGGTLNLGTTSSPGNNAINVNGTGQLLQNTTATLVSAVGNIFESNGTVLSSPVLSFTALTSGTATAIPGQPVTFTATVRPDATGSSTPTGSIDFVDTTTKIDLGTVPLSGGTASLNAGMLGLGTHVIQVTYTGDGTFLPSLATVAETVIQSIYILDPKAAGALSISGNASINVPGSIVVDSASTSALSASGNAAVKASSIQVVGKVQKASNASLSPSPATGAASVSNPLAGLAGPSTSGMTNYGSICYSGNGSYTLNPGIYKQISVSGNAKVTLNPGLYLIEGGGLTVSGNAGISGTGIMIYNTGSNYPNAGGNFGGITLSENGTFSLTASATSTGGTDAGILIFQPTANTRALSLSGNGVAGITGTVYAPSAQVVISGNASLGGSLIADELSLSGNGVSTQVADGSAGSQLDNANAGTLLAGNLFVYISDPTGLFTANELSRIQDAINAWDNLLVPYSVTIAEVSDPSLANVVIDTGTTSAAGSASDGILGCYNSTGEITILQVGTGTTVLTRARSARRSTTSRP